MIIKILEKKDITAKEMIYGIKRVHSGEDFYCNSVLKLLTDENNEVTSFNTHQVLSKREKIVLNLIAEGLGNKAMATQLYLSIRTIETHRRNIMKKLDIHSSAGLARYALEHKIS